MISSTSGLVHEVCGVIDNVDVPGRQLTMIVDEKAMVFDVALDCTITLHQDRVKLRLLQPLDHARVTYSDSPEVPIAHAVSVNWWLKEIPHVRADEAFPRARSNDGMRSVG